MMDIVERLRHAIEWHRGKDTNLLKNSADEIERLREALKVFADNVKETNIGIDENWAKTVYPLKAENQLLREALHQISLASQNSMDSKEGCGKIARKALGEEK